MSASRPPFDNHHQLTFYSFVEFLLITENCVRRNIKYAVGTQTLAANWDFFWRKVVHPGYFRPYQLRICDLTRETTREGVLPHDMRYVVQLADRTQCYNLYTKTWETRAIPGNAMRGRPKPARFPKTEPARWLRCDGQVLRL